MRRALDIDEKSYGPEHPNVAIDLNNLAGLLKGTNRLEAAEPLSRRMVGIFLDFTRRSPASAPRRGPEKLCEYSQRPEPGRGGD